MNWTRAISMAVLAVLGACAQGSFEVAASGSHVTIAPAGVVQVHDKATQSFTVTPDADYTTVSAVTGSCPAGSWAGNVYTTGKITASCLIGFSAVRQTFSVSSSGSHVTIAPGGTQTAAAGVGQPFTVTADWSYTTLSTVGGTCPAGTWSGAVYTTGAITGDCTVTFSASLDAWQVTASGDSFETITPGTSQTVGDGATPTFSVTAKTGYTTSSTVGGTCPAGAWNGSLYSTGVITSSCTVTFSATLDTSQVTASGDSFETITPSTPQTVGYGATKAFSVTPNAHYVMSSTVGGTCPAGTWSGAVYTTGAIVANCTVSFAALRTYQVTPSGDSNEAIAPSTPQTVVTGEMQAFTVTASHDWKLSATVGGTCPAGKWSGGVYTTGTIIADCTVLFSATPVVVVTVGNDPNVSISPGGTLEIPPGSPLSITVTPNAGEAASLIPAGTCPAGSWSGAVYTTSPITADCSITFNGVTPVFQPATWTNESLGGTASTANVTGATDTVQIAFNTSSPLVWSLSAIGTATTDEIVRFKWDLNCIRSIRWGAVEAFSDGPDGQTVVSIVPNTVIESLNPWDEIEGTATLTLRSGYAFGFNTHAYQQEIDGTLTVSTIEDVPDVLITASGDSYETVAPAEAVVVAGTTPAFTVTPGVGDAVSASVGGTCPPGTWGGGEYMPGPVTSDCTLVFSGGPGMGGTDAGAVDAGVGSHESSLINQEIVTGYHGDCIEGDYAACIAACANGIEFECPDGGIGDAGAGLVVNDLYIGDGAGPDIKLDTDPPFYTALDWMSELWPNLPRGSSNLSASLSIINTNETLTFDSPPTLDVETGTLTFATTPGTYGQVTVLATLSGEGGASDGGLATATFTITVNTPPRAVDISQRFPWKSPCVPVTFIAYDTDSNDWLTYTLTSVPQFGYVAEFISGQESARNGSSSAIVSESLDRSAEDQPPGTGPVIPGAAPALTSGPMIPEFPPPGEFEQTRCYIPFSATWTGSDSFTVTYSDDHGGISSVATISIQVFEL